MWSLLAAVAAGLLALWGSNKQTKANNENIDKSLRAQSVENEKTRQYNLQLAERNNQWNIDQWNRANAYNSPEQQVARLRAAGLNPDMMYGGGISNTSTSSPQMTSGAPATSMDWSALANKRSIGDTVRESLEIAQMRANVEKTEAEADIAGSDSKVRDKLNDLGLEIKGKESRLLDEQINEVFARSRSLDYQIEEANWKAIMRRKFGDEYVEKKMRILSNALDLSDADLRFEVETLVNRIAGVNAENTKLSKLSRLDNENLRLLFDVIKYVLE